MPRGLTLCPGAPGCTQRRDHCSLLSKPHCRANEEIAQVRMKAKAESAALHAGLRKEQMKVESLERALQQKVTHPPCLLSASRAGFALHFCFAALSILLVLEVFFTSLAQKVFCVLGGFGGFLFAFLFVGFFAVV